MSIDFKSSFEPKRIITEILDKQEKILARALEEEITEIQERTQGGKDAKGATFKKYSDSYAKYKSSRNSKGQSRKISPPDLTYSGDMLRSITSKVQRLGAGLLGTIFLTGNAATKARENQKTRNFFGFSKEQIQRIKDKLQGN